MPAPVRVAHVLYSFGTGGLEKGIATVVRGASPGFAHTVVCLTGSGASERLLPPATPVVALGKPPGNSPAFLWRLSRVLRRLAPDVVHTRNWSGIDGVLAARLAGLQDVVHGEHGWGMDDPEGSSPRRLRVRRFVQRWVREYTCVSQAMVGWLRREVGVRRPITQIYNGIDALRYRPGPEGQALRETLGIAPNSFVLGVVGRLDPIKDHATLFRAFSRLHAADVGARLLVLGDGPERSRLESEAGEGVLFLGDRREVPELLRVLDVFVLPSRNEGISNTILEAMAAGLPVVATRVGGNPELVQDGLTGALVPPGDALALAAALEHYRAQPEAARTHGEAGRARVLERFAVDRMVASYEAVWARVAARCRRRDGG
ncbi:MAG: glycosyltransferase [Thermodesulfobacteriota bacterium]